VLFPGQKRNLLGYSIKNQFATYFLVGQLEKWSRAREFVQMIQSRYILCVIGGSLLIGVLLVAAALCAANYYDLSDTVAAALIAAAAGSISIVASVALAAHSAAESAKQKRQQEAREVRRQYFHQFLEVMSRKFALDRAGQDSVERQQATSEFCIEVNRLPLYASQNLVEMISRVASGNDPNPDFSKLYSAIRKDLCDDSFEPFENLAEFHFQVPNPPQGRGHAQ
jgi:hypothetical protein